MSAVAQVDFGTCWGTPSGQDLSMPSYMASGFQVVAEAVLRRWSTTRGRLVDDPNYGTNVTDEISDDLSPRDVAYLQQKLAAEAQKDERVLRAQVLCTLVAGVLTVVGSLTTAAGPFRLVVVASAAGVQLVSVSS
jgi:hypothetical protein